MGRRQVQGIQQGKLHRTIVRQMVSRLLSLSLLSNHNAILHHKNYIKHVLQFYSNIIKNYSWTKYTDSVNTSIVILPSTFFVQLAKGPHKLPQAGLKSLQATIPPRLQNPLTTLRTRLQSTHSDQVSARNSQSLYEEIPTIVVQCTCIHHIKGSLT